MFGRVSSVPPVQTIAAGSNSSGILSNRVSGRKSNKAVENKISRHKMNGTDSHILVISMYLLGSSI